MPGKLQPSRIGRRVIALFILSALAPLGVCALFLLREFSVELDRAQRQSLDDIVRNFGMNLLGRLNSADDVLRIILDSGARDDDIQDSVSKLPWVRSLHRLKPRQQWGALEQNLPQPGDKPTEALQEGRSIILWGMDQSGMTQVYLVSALPSGAWQYAELNPDWLWSDAGDYAGRAAVAILDDHGEPLLSSDAIPEAVLQAYRTSANARQPPGSDSAPIAQAQVTNGWMYRSWEMFLGGRYVSPSWHVLAVSEHPGIFTSTNHAYPYLLAFMLLTILLISWLSMISIRRQLHPLELLKQAASRVAQRDFAAFSAMTWKDEFGDLARAFDSMSNRLQLQFSALETLGEADRLLLRSPDLESILATLLPRLASLIRCQCISVALFDADAAQDLLSFGHVVGQTDPVHARRVALDVAALRNLCRRQSPDPVPASGAEILASLLPDRPSPVGAYRVHPLTMQGDLIGALCLGYADASGAVDESGIRSSDVADRLSLVLANLRQAERLSRQASYDALTGLLNRHLFSDHVRDAVAAATTTHGIGGLLYIDLDHFKRVNDTAGHATGDALLRIVAERLAACVVERASISRLGGDEFALLLPSIADADSARRVAERVIAVLEEPIHVGGREHRLSASVGIALLPADGREIDELLKAGDIAMYHAKDGGRGRAVFFQAQMQRSLNDRIKLEQGLRAAHENGELTLHYQPIVGAGGSLAIEALVRWPGRGLKPVAGPDVFIPIAEENGMIVQMGDWILRTACSQFARWRAAGLPVQYVSVNVSVRQLRERDYLSSLSAALKNHGMSSQDLQLEITESVLAHGAEIAQTLSDITRLGVQLALDDFGTGYSSLSYLRTYPIHAVKIDRSFVRGLPDDAASAQIAESIIAMCTALGKRVIAEGVETDEQSGFLRRAGCYALQGYLFGRPMEAGDIPGMLQRLLRSGAASGAAANPPAEVGFAASYLSLTPASSGDVR